jgi:hypothetical protein
LTSEWLTVSNEEFFFSAPTHDPENCAAGFPKDHANTKELKRDDDQAKSRALAWPPLAIRSLHSNGTSILVRRSSHAGTGSFFERMKSGLNNFD